MKLKHWLRLGAFAVVACLLLTGLTNFLCATDITDMVGMYGFYQEPKNSIDVALMGPSNIQTSFYSPLAYKQYGFTSYALSTGGMRGSCYLSAIREILSSQTPQVFVVDIWGFLYEDQLSKRYVRNWIDALPNSKNRTATIHELIDKEDWPDYILRYQKYHGNYISLERCINLARYKSTIHDRGYSIVKNFVTKTDIAPINDMPEDFVISQEGFLYLRQLLDFFHDQGVEKVLFVRTLTMQPYQETPSLLAAIGEIRAAGYDYLDLTAVTEEMNIDRSQDFYNGGHVNIFGAEKITIYLGDYLISHYNLETNHSQQATQQWNHCASYNEKVFSSCKKRTQKKERRFLHEDDFFS